MYVGRSSDCCSWDIMEARERKRCLGTCRGILIRCISANAFYVFYIVLNSVIVRGGFQYSLR